MVDTIDSPSLQLIQFLNYADLVQDQGNYDAMILHFVTTEMVNTLTYSVLETIYLLYFNVSF